MTVQSISILLLLGLTETIGIYFYMKMHTHSELSVSTILSRTRMLWVPLFAFLIIGEILMPIEYLGIAVLFLGVSIVSSPKKMFVDPSAKYANASAIMIAINIVLYKLAMPFASNSVILAALAFPSVILLPILMKNARRRIKVNIKSSLWLKLLTISFNIISLIFFALAMEDGEASKVNAVYQGMLVFAVVAGIIFLKERDNIPKKIIGTTITIIGVILLSLY
jgi:drug/metabolite transporter (DMT)-like permease